MEVPETINQTLDEDDGIASRYISSLPQIFAPEHKFFSSSANNNQPIQIAFPFKYAIHDQISHQDPEKYSEDYISAFFTSLIYWNQPVNTVQTILITLAITLFIKNFHFLKFFSAVLALSIVCSLFLLKLLSFLSSNKPIFPMNHRLACLSWTHVERKLIPQAKINKWAGIIADGLEWGIRQFVRIILVEDQNRSTTFLFCAVMIYFFALFFSASAVTGTAIIISLIVPKLYDMNKVIVNEYIGRIKEMLREWYYIAEEKINTRMAETERIKKEQ